MPTRDEKVAQIEAALRARFFKFVPKIENTNRAGWPEAQHDLDRLSRSLAAYVLVGRCQIDDATASGAITDGSDDCGIDALYYDRPGSRLVLVQSKFKQGGAAPAQDEVQKTINGVRYLVQRNFDKFNEAVRKRLDDIEDALDTPGVPVELHLAFLGEVLGTHATNDLNAFTAELNRLTPVFDWHRDGFEIISNWMVGEQVPTVVDGQMVLENWASVLAPRKALYGQISAAALAKLVQDHGKALFERNIRHYLGTVGVNSAIEEAVRVGPADFFYLNNGITVVCESITQAAGTPAKCVFELRRFSVVNGAQTAGAIATAALAGELSAEAKVLITVIEIGDSADDIGRRITRSRNYQNVVRGVDFAALDPNQERIRQELASAGISYFYRPSAEARARSDDAFTLEEGAIAIACLGFRPRSSAEMQHQPPPLNAVDFVVAAKREVGRLWDQGGSMYGRLFSANLSGVRLVRLVKIYQFIDSILASTERSETGYHRRMFFRHARHFIMAFVAMRSADVVGRPQLDLSDVDKTLLSQRTNELAELIYSISEQWQGSKGYRAMFRNLTDAQPLADTVLQRLVEQGAQQVQPSVLPPANGALPG